MTTRDAHLQLSAEVLRTMQESRLARRAEGIKVLGVPHDLVVAIQRLGPAPILDILTSFYLPNLLTYAFIRQGLQTAVFARSPEGELTLPREVSGLEVLSLPGATDEARPLTGATDEARSMSWRQSAVELMNDRRDITHKTAALCIGDREGLCLCLASAGAQRVVALDTDDQLLARYARAGIETICGDVRVINGLCLGIFDIVTSHQVEKDHDESILNTVVATLRPYGAYYTRFANHEDGAPIELERFRQSLEQELIITDVVESAGSSVFRAVKYPELRSDPSYFRDYVP